MICACFAETCGCGTTILLSGVRPIVIAPPCSCARLSSPRSARSRFAALIDDLRVLRGDLRMRDDDFVVGRAANRDRAALQLREIELAEIGAITICRPDR